MLIFVFLEEGFRPSFHPTLQKKKKKKKKKMHTEEGGKPVHTK